MPTCLLRRDYDPVELVRAHPPAVSHDHKRLLFELAMTGPAPAGSIALTRWAPSRPEANLATPAIDLDAVPGVYDYRGPDAGVWHVNFADPQLFVAYGSGLLAQDELQVVEHPALASIREALLAEGQPALTVEAGEPTPVLIAGVERRCVLATAPDLIAGRPYGLYGNRFARADAATIRGAVQLQRPPTHTNLIAIAAPFGGRGRYTHVQIDRILTTAFTGFSAAVAVSRQRWPGVPVEIRTGFWGCGAFGGNRAAMTLLQIVAARLASVDRLRIYVFDDAGHVAFRDGAARCDAAGAAAGALVSNVEQLGYEWGVGDGT